MTEFSFDRLMHPFDPGRFLAEHWENEPLLIARQDSHYYASLFSASALESILQYARPGPQDVRVVRDQIELAPDRYRHLDGRINMNQLYKAYGEGNTLVINGLQRFAPRLARLGLELQALLNFAVEFNAYLTPSRSQGLHPHFDTHDVFVLQVEGSKTWHLYGAAERCPLLASFQPVIPVANLPAPAQVVELSAGDLLYVPRGHVHDALTSGEHSLHITIGIYPTQWLDLLVTALTNLSLTDLRFRRALPVGYLNHPSRRAEVDAGMHALIKVFADQASSALACDVLADQLIRKTTPVADDQFASIESAMAALSASTRLIKRDHMRCRVYESGETVSIHFPGNTIKASREYRDALLWVAGAAGMFEVGELPDSLDPGRKIILAQRLVRGGLLRVAQPGEANADGA